MRTEHRVAIIGPATYDTARCTTCAWEDEGPSARLDAYTHAAATGHDVVHDSLTRTVLTGEEVVHP